jgi:simple sugar transport system permease protein
MNDQSKNSGGASTKTKRRMPASVSVKNVIASVFTLVLGLIITIVLIQAQGYQAIPTIMEGLKYSLGDTTQIARTIAWGLPLAVAALGVALAFRSGMFNLGAEGQIYAGALATAIAGIYIGPFFPGVHIAIVTLAGAAAGATIAAGLGWLRAAWGVDEVLSTLLSNYIIILFGAYLVTNQLRDPTRQSGTTQPVLDTSMFSEIIPKTGLTGAIYVVGLLALAVWWLSERSVVGYRWRMTGESPSFAAAVGINVKSARISSMAVSGALAGIAGSLLVSASQGRYWTEIGSGIGWDAVLIALIGRARILPTLGWVAIYTVMRSSARGIEQVSSVPAELSLVLIAAIIVIAAARPGVFIQVDQLRHRYFSRKNI